MMPRVFTLCRELSALLCTSGCPSCWCRKPTSLSHPTAVQIWKMEKADLAKSDACSCFPMLNFDVAKI